MLKLKKEVASQKHGFQNVQKNNPGSLTREFTA